MRSTRTTSRFFRVRRVALTVEGARLSPEWLLAAHLETGWRSSIGWLGTLRPAEGVDALPHSSPIPAHGVVYSLRPFELDELRRREKGYTLEVITVESLQDGEALQVQAFISSEWHCLKRPVAPTRRYADLVLSGAEERGLPPAYIDWLRDELKGARQSQGVPSTYYETKSRRVASVVVAAWAFGLVGWPVTRRVAECSSAGWQPGTSCESFFVPVRDE